MKAITWHGTHDMRLDTVPDPKIEDPGDCIVKITATGICGSDLHLYDGQMPTMQAGDVVGHEPMGVVAEVGAGVKRLKVGDRVVVPFTISCGECFFCKRTEFSLCDNSNRNAERAAAVMGQSPAGLFGYSHMLGGYAGGQAEYLRVPYADVGPIKVESNLSDEQVVLLSDIFPTGYMAAENAEIARGDTVAVWGCGPVSQFIIRSAWMFGAGRVIAIDQVPERLAMARDGKAETIDFSKVDVYDKLQEMTGGRGPDRGVDGVGCEAHMTTTAGEIYADVKTAVGVHQNSPAVLNQMIKCVRKGGTLSVPGVYTATVNGLLFSALMNKAQTVRTGQTHVQRYLAPLLKRIEDGEIEPASIITHTAPLEEGPGLYETFRAKKDGCIKVVLKPN